MTDTSLLGQTINNAFEIVDIIAHGGMATVYRAHQLSMNRDVAVKVLPREFLHEPTFLSRFKQEAAIAARLEHRAIVPVFDYGEWERMPYIVMRYMPGGSVDRLIDETTVELDTAQKIIRQVASALDYAHRENVLHRDLKPSNILLDHQGDAYITDFGIARILSSNQNLTATGVVGTPAYMSPEQAQGLTLDARSDLYALGVVIYEMLTGRRPFEGETPYSIAVKHVTEKVPPPRTFKPDIPPGVEAVVMKVLAKDPNHRYRSATELAGALEDADLMPALDTAQSTPPPITPAPYSPTDPSTHPTPQRQMKLVSQYAPAVQSRQRPSPFLIAVVAILVAAFLASALLAAYLILTDDGEPVEQPDFVATGVFRLTATAEAVAQLPSYDGRILFVADRAGQADLYILDLATGNQRRITQTEGAEGRPTISPDGEWIAYVYDLDGDLTNDDNSRAEIYIQRLDGTGLRQITSNLFEDHSPVWSGDSIYSMKLLEDGNFQIVEYTDTEVTTVIYEADGIADLLNAAPSEERLVFGAGDPDDLDTWEIFALDIAEGTTEQLTDNDSFDGLPAWHPDASLIAWRTVEGISEMQANGDDPTVLLEQTATSLVYSPDGDYVIFTALDDAGETNLFVLERATAEVRQLTFAGGYAPLWLPN